MGMFWQLLLVFKLDEDEELRLELLLGVCSLGAEDDDDDEAE